jgi:septal ring factor EnvC (AmiA/AmiB activator)
MNRLRHTVTLAIALSASFAAPAHGDRGPHGGIIADIEISRALRQIDDASAKRDQLASQLAQLQLQERERTGALTLKVRALYRLTRSGMAPVTGGFEAIRQHVARVRRLKLLVESDQRALESLAQRESSARKAGQLANQSVTQAREQLSALQSQQTMNALAVEMQSPQPTAAATSNEHGFYGVRFSSGASVTSSFESLRGKLAAPVTGEVRVSDAHRGPAEGPALLFEAPAGSTVRAAAAGRVAFCDQYGKYGRLIVLDHGGDYYTAYGGLGSIEVRAGDDVSAYARIGDIGSEGDPPALLFEVRKGNRAIPPRPWLGL